VVAIGIKKVIYDPNLPNTETHNPPMERTVLQVGYDGGDGAVDVDLLDLLTWVKNNRPDLLPT
jgi:hypothetical protein